MKTSLPRFEIGRSDMIAAQSPEHARCVEAITTFQAVCDAIGPKLGGGALLSGLLSTYMMVAVKCNAHAEAIASLELAIKQLRCPETIEAQLTAHGRA